MIATLLIVLSVAAAFGFFVVMPLLLVVAIIGDAIQWWRSR